MGEIRRASDVPSAYVASDLFMMSVELGQYFSLNEVATRIWELLEYPTTAEAMVAKLVFEYDVAPEECAEELKAFLVELRLRKLVADVA